MEKIPNKRNSLSENNSRRNFIKDLAIFTGGVALTSAGLDTFASDKNNSNESNVENYINDQIEKCKEIINNNKYDEILDNPFLVSTLYYSSNFIDKLEESQNNNQQKIIAGISKHITPEFRNNYMKWLDGVSISKDYKQLISDKERIPLEYLGIPKDLSKNHQDAIDLFIKEGSVIFPIASGLVVLAEEGWNKNDEFSTSSLKGGNTVVIYNYINKSFYRYAHLRDVHVKTGEIIDINSTIGTVGNSGLNASKPGHGCHLHLEVNVYFTEFNNIKSTNVYELKNRLIEISNKDNLFVSK